MEGGREGGRDGGMEEGREVGMPPSLSSISNFLPPSLPLSFPPSLPPPPQTTGSALSYLEHRQEWVLSQISMLQERVRTIGMKLGVGPTDIGIIQQVRREGGREELSGSS